MEIDLLEKISRKTDRTERLARRRKLTSAQRAELCRFGREYFDGPDGYGGYYYDGRHEPAVRDMIERYGLKRDARVLDIGCAKGFMLYEFMRQGVNDVHGCDIGPYAVENAHPAVKDRLTVTSADDLALPDASFDLVYSIDVVHNLPPDPCDRAIHQMMRVSRGAVFVQVASYETPEQERALIDWGVTVQTLRSKQQWREAFDRLEFGGDFFFKTF